MLEEVSNSAQKGCTVALLKSQLLSLFSWILVLFVLLLPVFLPSGQSSTSLSLMMCFAPSQFSTVIACSVMQSSRQITELVIRTAF